MKNILSILGLLLMTITLNAQTFTSKGFSYQTVLRDITRQVLVHQDVTFRFSILADEPNGSIQYAETHTATTNQFGLANLIIGEGQSVEGDFEEIGWGSTEHFLQVEILLKEEDGFQFMGTTKLLAVPLAVWEVSDDDRSADNELQLLEKNGQIITLSQNGGEIVLNDDDPNNEVQDIIKEGNTLSLTRSDNTITLQDDDPNNELQDLKPSLFGNTLYIGEEGTGVNLSNFMDSPWTKYSSSRIYYPSQVAIGGISFSSGADLTVNGSSHIVGGGLTVKPSSGNARINLTTLGYIYQYGNSSFSPFLSLAQDVANSGHIRTNGPNGRENITLGSLASNPNHGYISIYDDNGRPSTPNTPYPVAIFVDNDGNGRILCNGVKHFTMPHPKQKDKQILYACIEGPEAAAYQRGTSSLVNGEVFIPYSEHFSLVINPETVTVNLTPMSANSKGLAVIEKRATGFLVKELNNGTGNYDFDWEVKGVRQGYEDYKVIRDSKDFMPALPDRS